MSISWLAVAALLLVAAQALAAAPAGPPAGVIAGIRLHNPTAWGGPVMVEVPVGHLATPGLIDWGRVHLELRGRRVPFAIREGRPHWRAGLIAPVKRPRAEDLLVFSCAVPPGEWVQLSVVPGAPARRSCLSRRGDRLTMAYPNLRVVVSRSTGLLQSVEAFGQPMLDGPLSIAFHGGEKKERLPEAPARLIASSSTPAMTELHFLLNAGGRPEMALTYRVHACGLVEVWLDERPWGGVSPWLDRSLEVRLALAGRKEPLPLLANRAPYYGFNDYAAVVAHPAALYHGERAAVLELGEETTNGRRWNRRLYVLPPGAAASDGVEMADEGLVVDVQPMTAALTTKTIQVSYPAGAKVPAETLARAIAAAGVPARAVSEAPGIKAPVALRLVSGAEAEGIEGDGFAIRRRGRAAITIEAGTRFGLMQAALRAASADGRFALIASNPAAHLRAGGFGGGDFEVDFPYGSDAEWEQALDALVASGMNVMADLGMWSNWKMPVSYKHMPEIRSDSAEAFDEASGARFSEIEQHCAHGLKLLRYLQERGVKVWCWLPVGCVPTTYARRYPEAMAPGSDRVPCHTHPHYTRYLQALLAELLETYPLDGIVMIRDDNGGICGCPRCTRSAPPTPPNSGGLEGAGRVGSAAWEQYLIVYDWLRAHGFKGEVAVYPYNDRYEPRLGALLPPDLYVVGHGSGAAMLSHAYPQVGPMGDTWLDNLFASFRVPSSPRMKRLLADRGSFWIGGAYCGTELPWEAVGFFGWEPTATVNTFRYRWGARRFGKQSALAYVRLSNALEHLWDLYDAPMLPQAWVKLTPEERAQVAGDGREWLRRFEERLAEVWVQVGLAPPTPPNSGGLSESAGPNSGGLGAGGSAPPTPPNSGGLGGADARPDPANSGEPEEPAAPTTPGRDARVRVGREVQEPHAPVSRLPSPVAWLAHVKLFGTYFGYHLRRLEAFSEMREIVGANRGVLETAGGISKPGRQRLIDLHQEIYALAEQYDREAAAVPGHMMERTRANQMARPFREWVGGYDPSLDALLDVPQFAGSIEVEPAQVPAGREFALRVRLRNTGVCPWIPGAGHRLEIAGDRQRLGLPDRWEYEGAPAAFGDRREVVLRGTAPEGTGEAKLTLSFLSPFRNPHICAKQEMTLTWR